MLLHSGGNTMKKSLAVLFSIILVLASVFGLFACLAGLKDIKNIKDYKSADAEEANEGLALARDGIGQLEENELAYTTGVGEFEAGQRKLAEGKKQLAEGAAKLSAGEAALAAGQAELDANTQAYNEGKAKLAKIQPLMPYVNMYVSFRNSNLSNIAGFSDAQAWFASVVKPVAAKSGLQIPDDVNDLPGYIQSMVTDGQAQIKKYEDGVAALEAGKRELKAGYADYHAGQKELAAGEKQLEEGLSQLKLYEDGQATLADGMYQLLDGMGASQTRSGRETAPSLEKMLGEDFSVYMLNEDGSKVQYHENDFVDIDACALLCDRAEEYLSLQEADVTSELYSRVAVYAIAALACVFGLIAGIAGITAACKGGLKTGKVPGIICALLAVSANIVGLFTRYADYAYGVRDASGTYTYSGDLQLAALIVLAAAAIVFVIVSSKAKKSTRMTNEYKKYMEAQLNQ